MKIAVIGSHSTGKTTIAEILHSYLLGRGLKSRLVPEIARKCPYPVNQETSVEAQQWILMQQIKEEKLCEKDSDFIITDRSVLDNYVYLFQHLGKNNEELHHIMLKHLSTYDYLLYTVPMSENSIKDDGFRSIDPKFRDIIDELLKNKIHNLSSFLKKNNVSVLAINQETIHSFVNELVNE
jgi:nicotinamide riboside kinase